MNWNKKENWKDWNWQRNEREEFMRERVIWHVSDDEPQVQSPAALASVADPQHDGRTFARLDAMVEKAESRVS